MPLNEAEAVRLCNRALVRFFHDKHVVEATQEEVLFFGGFVPVPSLELLVVAHDADDVDGFEVLAHDGEELEADGHEGAALFALVLFE